MNLRQKGGVFFSKAIPPLIEIIEEQPSPDMADLFTAAGSAIALLYEAHFVMEYQSETGSDHTDDDDEDKTNFEYSNRNHVDTEYIKSLLEGMTAQSGKGHKKDKIKAQ